MEDAGARRPRRPASDAIHSELTCGGSGPGRRAGGYAAGTSAVLAQPAPPPRNWRSRPGHSPVAQTPRSARVLGASGEQLKPPAPTPSALDVCFCFCSHQPPSLFLPDSPPSSILSGRTVSAAALLCLLQFPALVDSVRTWAAQWMIASVLSAAALFLAMSLNL
ncbi:hypothetical protein VTN02DRAFT_4057 [Thermoascus thermophilus]